MYTCHMIQQSPTAQGMVWLCVCVCVCECVCIYSKYLQGRYTEGQQAHEKMINTTHH